MQILNNSTPKCLVCNKQNIDEILDFGKMALVMVGATNVGHMRVMYDEHVQTNMGASKIDKKVYDVPKQLERGDELGVFEMGSTVVLITESKVSLSDLPVGTAVKMGQSLGGLVSG